MKHFLNIAIAGFFAVTCARSASSTAEPSDPHIQAMAMGDSLPTTLAGWSAGARLLDGLGDYHRPVRTKSSSAQSYFDQGMRLLWGFNHDESTRSFARALELDPACAMCAWGVAMTVGPNYNVPMLAAARAKIAFETTKRAQRLAGSSRTVEQALISTLEKRYPNALALDPESSVPVLTAYAAAMRIVARRYPGDLDVQTLYAESLMNIHAWKLWSADGMPAEGTTEIIAELESVLKRDPTHMGALHYYVHAVEASPHPESGLAAAARLRTIAPSAGHLIHMPAHIFHRVGRYEESAEANRRAAAADLAYFAKMSPIDYYPAMYASHNYQFLAYSASAEGREAETIDAVRRSRASVSDSQLQEMPGTDWYVAEIYTAPVRFGRWDLLLAEPAPATGSASLNGGYLYATAVALAASNHPVEARDRLARLDALIASVAPEVPAGQNTLRDVLGVARRVAAARIASEEGHGEDAIRELGEAVALEDGLAYDEPSGWFFPVRHLLGVELLRAGRANDAEITYRDDLLRHPGSGWSLFGLMQALKAERRDAEANDVEREFRIAWTHATISINASAF